MGAVRPIVDLSRNGHGSSTRLHRMRPAHASRPSLPARVTMSDEEHDPAELSRRLVYLAAERTLSSWIRTALSLMALGFVIDRFGLLVTLRSDVSAGQLFRRALLTDAGTVLVAMGTAMAVAAGIRYLHFAVTFHHKRGTGVRHGLYWGTGFAFVLAAFGIGLIVVLLAVLK